MVWLRVWVPLAPLSVPAGRWMWGRLWSTVWRLPALPVSAQVRCWVSALL
jgi:hypothetical protein